MKTLLKNGTLVSAERTYKADLLIDGGVIAQIAPQIDAGGTSVTDANVIDAAGMLVFPGFIDAHTHFDMDSGVITTVDDFDAGTRSAVASGTTTVLDFATQQRGHTLEEAAQEWHAKAGGKSHCNYGFHMAITDWNDETAHEMSEMTRRGITSYKVYLAYDALRLRDGDVFGVLEEAARQGAIVGAHCENGDLVDALTAELRSRGHTEPTAHPLSRPVELEAEAVTRFLAMAELAHCRAMVVHTSSRAGLEAALAAKRRGVDACIETCPQYLLLTDERYALPGFEGAKYVISPPLRTAEDTAALWGAVSSGEIDTVATDHCAFSLAQKELGRGDFTKIPGGAPGVQTRPALLYTHGVAAGRITARRFCALLSENPAKLYGMYPRKGCLAVGSDADIVIWDSAATGTITAANQLSNCDYTPFEGMATVGEAAYVFVNGQPAAQRGAIVTPHLGEYVARGTGR